ncbi:hypothetical protein [Absidia glauca]|uniref:GRF-type domain-containing protein n=1 Tax=Absidia glauca TaxID=4829 RepID=A0A168MJT7_ABSGL|nr:hypothetical protein [Absidia glauca]
MSTIPRCRCGDICLSKEAYRNEENRGRWYWKCRTGGCRFFAWNEPEGELYTPIIHKPVESSNKREDNFEPCANHSINLNHHQEPDVHPSINMDHEELGLDPSIHSNHQEPAPFAYSEHECPLVARKSRLSNPYRNKMRAATDTKTRVDMALCSDTDISIKADTRRRYIQTLLNTLPRFRISGQETQPMVVWSESRDMWVFSADQLSYNLVWNLMKKHRGTFEVSGVPTAVLRVLPVKSPYLYDGENMYGSTNSSNDHVANQDDHDGDDDNSLDWMGSWFQQQVITGSKLWQTMTSDQRSKMKKGVKLGGNIFFQNPEGGAKCLQALGVALVHHDKWPAVVVCNPDSTMVWKRLIQDMLSLKSRDICILDPLPYFNGKLGLSTKPKAVRSRIYRQRKRELLRQQQLDEQEGVASPSTSAPSPSLVTLASSSSLSAVSPPLFPLSPKDGIHLDSLQHQNGHDDNETWYIALTNDSGDPVNPPRRRKPSSNNKSALPPPPPTPPPKDSTLSISEAPDNSPSNVSVIGQKRPHTSLTDENGEYTYNIDDGFDWSTNVDHYGDDKSDDDDDDDDDNDDNDNDNDKGDGNDNDNDSNIQDTASTTVDGSTNGDMDDEEGEAYNQSIFDSAQFFIISYEKVKTRLRALGKKCNVVIFDDCHEIRNYMLPAHQAAVQRFINASTKTIMVSHMELASSPKEAFPFLKLLRPNIFMDFKYFGHRYCGAKHLVFGWDYMYTSNTEELQFLLDKVLLVC